MPEPQELDLSLYTDKGHSQQLDNSNPFLNAVAEEDRPIVGKYIKDWDKGVQDRFTQIHEQYAPFKGLDVDDVETAMQIKNMLDNEPELLYSTIRELLAQQGIEMTDSNEGTPGTAPEWDGIPKEFVDRFNQMESVLTNLGEAYIQDRTTASENQEMKQLDEVMDSLHNEYGDFDDRWVLSRIAGGQDPEDAVAEYSTWVNELVSSQQRPYAPPIMGGSGQVPSGQVDVTKLGRGDTQKMVANILEAASRNT